MAPLIVGVVDGAVNIDDKLHRWTAEVRHEGADRVLTAELESFHLAISEGGP